MTQAATLTCPVCAHEQAEALPWAGALSHYTCKHCNALIERRKGDCCVFASYGAVACPCKQRQESACAYLVREDIP